MFVVNSLSVAIVFCVLTMLGWGSWANTQKLAGKEKWPFELFYWDYAIGVFLFGLVFAHTFGSFGSAGSPAPKTCMRADCPYVWPALISGAIFNLSNILLVVGIGAAGMSVAFPVGVGPGARHRHRESYVETPKGNPALLFAGVALIVFAMVMSAIAHSRLPRAGHAEPVLGRDLLGRRRRHDGLFLPAVDALHLAELQLGADRARHADAVRRAGLFRRRACWSATSSGTRSIMRVGRRRLSRLLPRQREAARHRHPGRLHLDGRAELQRDRLERGGPGDLIRARTGRHAGGGNLGTRSSGASSARRPPARRNISP